MKSKKKSIVFLSVFLLVFCVSQATTIKVNAQKAKYTIKTEKVEYKDANGTVRGVVSYEYPQFKGGSKKVKKINKTIKKSCNAYMKSSSAKELKEDVQRSIKSNRFWGDEYYFYSTDCKVTYNKNNIVSVAMTWKWHAGGAFNSGTDGFNYNLKTGKKLTYKDVISGNAKSKILKAARKTLGDKKGKSVAYQIIKGKKSYKFYFEPKKVYICFESYELADGPMYHEICVPGKYK